MNNTIIKRCNYLLIITVLVCSLLWTESASAQLITYRFEQIDSLQQVAPKKVVVFIHTDWCKYCHTMQNITLKDKKVIAILNEQFYFVNFDAEEKKPITFNRHTFNYKPNGSNTGIHQLAEQLATKEGKITYPTLCILNGRMEIVFQYANLISVNDLKAILKAMD